MMGNARTPSCTMVGNVRASAHRGSASDNSPASHDSSAAATTVVGAFAAILIIRIAIAAGSTISAAYNGAASNYRSPSNHCSTFKSCASMTGSPSISGAVSGGRPTSMPAAIGPDLHNLTLINRKTCQKAFGGRDRRAHCWQGKQRHPRDGHNGKLKTHIGQVHSFLPSLV